MEIRNGVIQLAGVKVRQHVLKIAEGLPRAAHHMEIFAAVEGDGGHIVAQPPEAVLVHQIVFPLRRMVKVQSVGLGVLFADVLGHPVNVAHQFHRVLERIGIHPLHQI